MTLHPSHPLNTGVTSLSPFIQSCRGNRSAHPPVWFMRQAGRSLPEYRRARAGSPMLDSCLDSGLVTELTLQPVRRYGVDAAIFFSDIVVPLKLAGINVTITPGVGPVIAAPIRTRQDFAALRMLENDRLAPITAAVNMLTAELGSTPLIGFGAAPFTLASYLIEGGPNTLMPHVRALMRNDPQLWHHILNWCGQITERFIRAQVTAGASAIQVFDSWAGRLTAQQYHTFAYQHSAALFQRLSTLADHRGTPVPRIHFGVGTQPILQKMHAAGATVMGIDTETSLTTATQLLGASVPLQGNISPRVLHQSWPTIERHVREVLQQGSGAAGHIVNLGHGVPKNTNPDVLARITDFAHQHEGAEKDV